MEKVVTPKFRVAFPSIFKPSEFNGKTNYSVTMIWDKDTDITELKKLCVNTAVEKWGDKTKKIKIQYPFRKGEEKDVSKYPVFEDTIFATAKSQYPCGLVDQKLQPILDENEFYAGCYARASVTAYASEYMGKYYVSLGLSNLQKLSEGDRLGSRTTATDDFDAVESGGSDTMDDLDLDMDI